MGLSFDELFPGRFLKSGQFKGKDVNLTIKRVRREELEGDKGKEMKAIVTFEETQLELVLNRTNGECLKALFGKQTDDWLGKRVTLWPAPFHDNLTGEDTTAIRVRGSPELAADKSFELKLPRKKGVTVVMKKTVSSKPALRPVPGTGTAPSSEPTGDELEEIRKREMEQAAQ